MLKVIREHFGAYKLLPGYAEQSTRRNPRCPETVVVGEDEIASTRCVGQAFIDNNIGWLAFKVKGKRQYFFQFRPW